MNGGGTLSTRTPTQLINALKHHFVFAKKKRKKKSVFSNSRIKLKALLSGNKSMTGIKMRVIKQRKNKEILKREIKVLDGKNNLEI